MPRQPVIQFRTPINSHYSLTGILPHARHTNSSELHANISKQHLTPAALRRPPFLVFENHQYNAFKTLFDQYLRNDPRSLVTTKTDRLTPKVGHEEKYPVRLSHPLVCSLIQTLTTLNLCSIAIGDAGAQHLADGPTREQGARKRVFNCLNFLFLLSHRHSRHSNSAAIDSH